MKKQAHYRFKTAALDLNKIKSLGVDVEYDEEPEMLRINTPGGHASFTPYQDSTVKHHVARMGEDAYHQGLANALKQHAKDVDANIKMDRDDYVSSMKGLNTFAGGLAGGALGAGGGHALGGTTGALIGGALGALGGGYFGNTRKVTPVTGPETVTTMAPLSQLYRESREMKTMREMQERMERIQEEEADARAWERRQGRFGYRYDDPDAYYGRSGPGYYY